MEGQDILKSEISSNPLVIKQTARYQAMESLVSIYHHQHYIHQEVNKALTQRQLPEKERDLYTRLVYGSSQYHFTLMTVLKVLISKPNRCKAWVIELLILSAYQFYYLDAIPAHALVNEAVKIAKKRGNSFLARFVNGVLREMMRRFEDIFSFIDSQEVEREEKLALEASLPVQWVNYFEKRFGWEKMVELAQSLKSPAQVTVRFSRKTLENKELCLQLAQQQGLVLQQSPINPHSYRVEKGNPLQTALFKEGKLTIQDEAAALAVDLLHPKEGQRVLDACSAPGGKTVQLAEYVGKNGQVVANELVANKLNRIQENLERMQVSDRVQVVNHDARDLPTVYEEESFDAILVDAPCSGLGLFRRKPDTKERKKIEDLKELQVLQLEILQKVSPLLKQGGKLLYSTCTISGEENEEVVQQFLESHQDFALVPLTSWAKPLEEALQTNGTLQILPHYFMSDGFFIALFEKTDGRKK